MPSEDIYGSLSSINSAGNEYPPGTEVQSKLQEMIRSDGGPNCRERKAPQTTYDHGESSGKTTPPTLKNLKDRLHRLSNKDKMKDMETCLNILTYSWNGNHFILLTLIFQWLENNKNQWPLWPDLDHIRRNIREMEAEERFKKKQSTHDDEMKIKGITDDRLNEIEHKINCADEVRRKDDSKPFDPAIVFTEGFCPAALIEEISKNFPPLLPAFYQFLDNLRTRSRKKSAKGKGKIRKEARQNLHVGESSGKTTLPTLKNLKDRFHRLTNKAKMKDMGACLNILTYFWVEKRERLLRLTFQWVEKNKNQWPLWPELDDITRNELVKRGQSTHDDEMKMKEITDKRLKEIERKIDEVRRKCDSETFDPATVFTEGINEEALIDEISENFPFLTPALDQVRDSPQTRKEST